MPRINRRKRADMTAEQFEAFRTAVRQAREKNGLTITALSELLECSSSHLSNIERGTKYPSDEFAKEVADVFDTTVDAMCGNDTPYADSDIARRIGKAYYDKRMAKGFNIKEAAGFLGIPVGILQEFELGRSSIGDSMMQSLNRLYKVDKEVETVEVVKEVPTESPVSLETIERMLGCITGMNIDKSEQIALFRELSAARTQVIERKLFG